MDSKQWASLKNTDKLKSILRSCGLSPALAQANWAGLSKTEKSKIEKATKGSGWHEEKEDVITPKGVEKKAPRHREVAIEASMKDTERTPMVLPVKEEKSFKELCRVEMTDEIYKAIRWWEQELTGEERSAFLGGELWSGSVTERHERLLSFYRKAKGEQPTPTETTKEEKAPAPQKEEEPHNKSGMELVNEFKAKIEHADDVNYLKALGVEIIDNVANGNFTRAKVVSEDIRNLEELIDDKMSRLYKERIGTTEEFSKKTPMNLIVISNEVNRLRELNKKIQASTLTQRRRDALEILINSKISGIRAFTPKQNVESLDKISDIKNSDTYKMLLIKISEFITLTQLNTFSAEFNHQMKLMGVESVEDPRISDIIKLISEKRKQLAGTKHLFTPEKYEIENLKYEAEHKPPEMLPPKEYEDTSKYTWGITEQEAIKKYTEGQRKKLQSNIDFTNKQGAELAETEKVKPWVLLTKAQILKQYSGTGSEEKLRDMWTYKNKKSDYNKNAESAKFWQDKVNKIDSGEWATRNSNYLRETYQKEVKEAIKHGKPVPFEIIKQYPEFTKAQDSRERYDKGRHTSFANVSIAVDTRHQENHGIKIKLQDGTAMQDKYADEIIRCLTQFQAVVGDITPIMKRENITIAHTKGKHPFLSTAGGVYHPTDITVTIGVSNAAAGAHELCHFLDETAKRRYKDQKLYNYDLIAFAKKNMNGGIYAVERAIALNKYKSEEELKVARRLRVMLGAYWKRVEEVLARLVEQYVAYKNREIPATDTALLHQPYQEYTTLPGWWDDETFVGMVPQIEAELKRKIELARD